MKKYTRKIFRIGRGYCHGIVIPREIAQELKLQERQKLTICRSGKKIILEDWKK